MGKTTIPWAHFTFNPWLGCQKIAPPCDHCYAEAWAKRAGRPELWQGKRARTTEANWRKPLKWNAEAQAEGVRYRVFSASLADVFDNEVPQEWRADLFDLIRRCENLDFMLLTKRIGNAKKMLPADWGDGYANVWIGATFGDQAELERDVVKLQKVPARVHFISHEPGLGPLNLERVAQGDIEWIDGRKGNLVLNALKGTKSLSLPPIDLVITGGESGGNARPYNIQWARDIVAQCRRNGRAAFVKQLGRYPKVNGRPYPVSDPRGEDINGFPPDLRVREFPRVEA